MLPCGKGSTSWSVQALLFRIDENWVDCWGYTGGAHHSTMAQVRRGPPSSMDRHRCYPSRQCARSAAFTRLNQHTQHSLSNFCPNPWLPHHQEQLLGWFTLKIMVGNTKTTIWIGEHKFFQGNHVRPRVVYTLKIQNRNPRNLSKFCCKALRPYLIYFDFSALFANLNKLLSHKNKSKEK